MAAARELVTYSSSASCSRLVKESLVSSRDRGHPAGEALRQPYAPQTDRRVPVEEVRPARSEEVRQGAREDADVGNGEVHPLRSGRRHDVRGVAGEEQPAVPHRIDDEAAHRDDALLHDGAFGQPEAVLAAEACAELLPDTLVGPALLVVARVALEIKPLQAGGARAHEREPSLVPGVDQLLRRARRLGEDAKPPEGIDVLVVRAPPLRDRGPADAV